MGAETHRVPVEREVDRACEYTANKLFLGPPGHRTARAWKERTARERPDSARRRAVAEVAHAVVQDDRPVVPRVEHGARGLGRRERHHCRRRRRGAGAGGVQNRGGRDERRAAKGEHR